MAEPVYRAEVTVWGLFPSAADLASPTTAWAGSAYFTAGDDMNAWGIEVRWQRNALAVVGLSLVYTFYFNAIGDPNTWTLVSGISSQEDLTPTFTFPQAITVAIQKDYDNNRLTFVTPLGAVDKALSGFTKDTSILRPDCHGAGMGIVGLETTDHGSEVEFRDFFGYRDMDKFIGAELSSADPGTWDPTTQYTGPSSGVAFDYTETQESFTYQWIYTFDAPTSDRTQTRHIRCWAGGDNLNIEGMFQLDAVVHPVTGTLLVAMADPDAPEYLSVLRSTDDGATFATIMVDDGAGIQVSDASIMVLPDGRVVVFYNNGLRGRMYYAVSYDDGLEWSTGEYYNVIDAFTGTPTTLIKPKFRCQPGEGLIWGFWYSESLAVIVGQKYPVLGENPIAGFLSVDSSITEYEWPDLWFTPTGEVRLRYRKAATGRIVKSLDWGNNWAVVEDDRSTEVRQSSLFDYGQGDTAHLYQSTAAGLAIIGSLSADGGDTFVSGKTAAVVSGVIAQYPALAIGHRGQLFALLWDGSTVACYRSEDRGPNWAAV